MKIVYRILMVLLFPSFVLKATEPDRHFVAGPGTIALSEDRFIMTFHQPHFPWYETDTLAICRCVKISDEFYMIRSTDPIDDLQHNMEVHQEYDEHITDGKQVTISLPARDATPIDISIYLNDRWSSDVINLMFYSEQASVLVPASTERIYFGFTPDFNNVVKEHPHGFTFQGIVTVPPLIMCPLEQGKNQITIRMGSLTDAFFERYHVQDEYIRIVDDCLYWRGVSFKREDSPDTHAN